MKGTAGAISTAPGNRSGRVAASSTAQRPPRESPTSTASWVPVASRTARASATYWPSS